MDTNYLREWRKSKYLSQPELAKLSGVSRNTIFRIEKGLAVAPLGLTIRKLAAALSIEPAELFREPERGGR